MNITIRDVSTHNEQEVLSLAVGSAQTTFIETSKECMEEAKQCPIYKPVGLYADGELVGFAMYGHFVEESEQGRVWLDRYFIDYRFQGLGLGQAMLNALITKLTREFTCDAIYLSVYEENEGAIRLYEKTDFHFNGELDVNNEKVMVKVIHSY